MFSDNLSVHLTTTHRLNHGEMGFEFACKLCSYRARYYLGGEVQKLEVLDVGNTRARHMSSSELNGFEGGIAQREESLPEITEEQGWLTPEIRAQLDEILKKF